LRSTVARRPKTRKQRTVKDKQRRRAQGALQERITETLSGVVRTTLEQALRDEVTALLGRAKGERRDWADCTDVAARCNRCGTTFRRQFSRAGTYVRSLVTFTTAIMLCVPRLSCTCGGMVDVEFVPLAPYDRVWFDLEERARELAGIGVSLRDATQVLAWENGQPLAIATLNRCVNETARLADALQQGALGRIPAVVLLDGLWIKVLEPTAEEFTDRTGRRRHRCKLRKFPLLVAYGVDPVTKERWVMDWEQGTAEDEASWRRLLERLERRGLRAEGGLRLFVHDGSVGLEQAFELVHFGRGVARQRCIFHKLQNVGRDVQGGEEMDRPQRRQRRREVLHGAAAVYQGTNAAEIKERLTAFRATWGEREPKAVATLEREFERTIVYLQVRDQARRHGQDWRIECLRSTSALERVQRHFRQKTRQVVIFHATQGVAAAIYLVIGHHHLLAGPDVQPWPRMLEEALLVA
jgi:transposase-like protein